MKKIILVFLFFTNLLFADIYERAEKAEKNNDMNIAINLYKKSALENDNAKAFFKLGKIYNEGKHVKTNYSKAINYFSAGYYLKDVDSTYNLALLYANSKTKYQNLERSLSIFLELARNGHAASQNSVGMFLTNGIVLAKDFKEAVKWYELSSKQGYVNAQCNLAFMYASGKGVWQNLGRANAFAKNGYQNKNKLCTKVWNDFNLSNYPEDKAFKLKFYTKP